MISILQILINGEIELENSYIVKEFNDDNGWINVHIPRGNYSFRVLDFNGWHPRQLCIDGVWRDVGNEIRELEGAIMPILSHRIHFNRIAVQKRF